MQRYRSFKHRLPIRLVSWHCCRLSKRLSTCYTKWTRTEWQWKTFHKLKQWREGR